MQTYNHLQVSGLPPQQGAVLLYRAGGNCLKGTCRLAGIALPTAKHHTAVIFKKYGVNRMPAAVAEAFKRGHLKYIPVFLLCMSIAFGGVASARTVRRPTRTTSYTRTITRLEISA